MVSTSAKRHLTQTPALLSFTGDRSKTPVDKSYSIAWYVEHPASIGHLHITSGKDVEAPLDFHPGYLDR